MIDGDLPEEIARQMVADDAAEGETLWMERTALPPKCLTVALSSGSLLFDFRASAFCFSILNAPPPMTIIVQCSCGRMLRAPDQMSGRTAQCVCGSSVTLLKDESPRQFDVLEPELGESELDAEEAPRVFRPVPKKTKGKSHFRSSQGRNVERGDPDDAAPLPLPSPGKRKKRRTDKITSLERKRQRSEPFLGGVIRSLRFPLRTESLITIAVMAVAYGGFTSVAGFMPYAVLGFKALIIMLLGTFLILGYFGFFLLQIFRLASIDEDDLPLTLEFDMDLIRQDLWIWLGTLWWCGVPFAVYWWVSGPMGEWARTPGIILAMIGFCLFLLPMALMSTALHLTVLAANPWVVLRSMLRVPLEYLATLGIFGVLCSTVFAIGRVLPPIPPVIPIVSHVGRWILLFYALTASAYGFGNFYYRNRLKIGWFGELPRQI